MKRIAVFMLTLTMFLSLCLCSCGSAAKEKEAKEVCAALVGDWYFYATFRCDQYEFSADEGDTAGSFMMYPDSKFIASYLGSFAVLAKDETIRITKLGQINADGSVEKYDTASITYYYYQYEDGELRVFLNEDHTRELVK